MMFDGYLFDFDGVIVDSEPLTLDAVHQVLRQYSVDEADLPQRNYQGWSWQAICADLDDLDLHIPQTLHPDEFAQAFEDLVNQRPPNPILGVGSAMRTAASLGRVGIVTASTGGVVRACLKRHGWSELVSVIVSADTYERPKPDPQCYLKAADKLGISITKTVVFEDSDVGLEGAEASGATVVAIYGRRVLSSSTRSKAVAHWRDFSEALETTFFGGPNHP